MPKNKYSSTKARKRPLVNKRIYIVSALLVALALLVVLELTDHINLFGLRKNPNPIQTTAGQQTKGEISHTKNSGTDINSNEESNDNTKLTNNESGNASNLVAPYGNFVSNHHPNLDGQPYSNIIQSACVTTSGASCMISFTKDSVTKSLPAETTDREGAAYWSWTLKQLGLTQGDWTIKATATLADQTKSTTDVLNLSVGP